MDKQRRYSTNEYLNAMKRKVRPKENLRDCPLSEVEKIRKEKTEALLECLKIEELKEAFETEKSFTKVADVETMFDPAEKYEMGGIENLPFPVYVVRPEKPNGEAVLYLHGHDPAGVGGAFVTRPEKEPYHKNIAMKMAQQGYTVYLPELMGFGEATYIYRPKTEEEESECFLNAGYLAMCGFSLAGMRTWQSLLVLEQMKADGFSKLGIFGVSGGGLIAMFTAVLAPEIEKIMLHSFMNSWEHSVLAKEQCVDNYLHGIIRVGESYEIAALLAPRRLLTINGTGDRPFPKEGFELATDYLKAVYKRLGASHEYTSILFVGRHEVNAEETLNWLKAQEE